MCKDQPFISLTLTKDVCICDNVKVGENERVEGMGDWDLKSNSWLWWLRDIERERSEKIKGYKNTKVTAREGLWALYFIAGTCRFSL